MPIQCTWCCLDWVKRTNSTTSVLLKMTGSNCEAFVEHVMKTIQIPSTTICVVKLETVPEEADHLQMRHAVKIPHLKDSCLYLQLETLFIVDICNWIVNCLTHALSHDTNLDPKPSLADHFELHYRGSLENPWGRQLWSLCIQILFWNGWLGLDKQFFWHHCLYSQNWKWQAAETPLVPVVP